MKTKGLFIIIIVLVLVFSCKRCPEGTKRADIKLSARTLLFLPNNISHTVTYKNTNNQLITFTTSGLRSFNIEKITDVPCSQALVSATYNFVEVEMKDIVYDNDSIQLYYNLSILTGYEIENPVKIDTNFVEGINLEKYNKLNRSDLSGLTLITDLRGKTLTNDSDNLYHGQFVFHNSYTIIDSTFTDVYSDVNNRFFYNKDLGIIGFVNNGILYRYKNTN